MGKTQIIGYARVSTSGQNIDPQIEILEKYGCDKIFQEKKSGKDSERKQLAAALDYVREGDSFVVTRLDRCSRSTADLYRIVDTLNQKGVTFKATEQEFDTSNSMGKMMLGFLSLMAEFETDLRRERQMEGIKAKQATGFKFGRKRALTDAQIEKAIELKKTKTVQEIADDFGVKKVTLDKNIARYLKEKEDEKNVTMQ